MADHENSVQGGDRGLPRSGYISLAKSVDEQIFLLKSESDSAKKFPNFFNAHPCDNFA